MQLELRSMFKPPKFPSGPRARQRQRDPRQRLYAGGWPRHQRANRKQGQLPADAEVQPAKDDDE